MKKNMSIKTMHDKWLANIADEYRNELLAMSVEQIEEAFYCDLSFGTGGVRGIIGIGPNKLNIYTIAKITQGYANYLIHNRNNNKVVISYDSRINSKLFAETTAQVLLANGLEVFLFDEIMPTPCLSFAIRRLSCVGGVMITASHNSSEYNGYKIYDELGCQITDNYAIEIQKEIATIDEFDGVKKSSLEIKKVPGYVFDEYIDSVKKQSILLGNRVDKNLSIVYTPLNGTGLKPVLRVLKEEGFNNVKVIKEQEKPDGKFSTCKMPNPEEKSAMELGIKYCQETDADILLATDPDCDRCGIAIKDNNDYKLLSTNEVGLLLFDFICNQRIKNGKMPKQPVMIKTIVSNSLAEIIAEKYGVEVINVLTGFKYIGEAINKLEEIGRENDFIFSFEESCGYLSGTYVRDKDGVNAVLIICEMAAFYKSNGLSLITKLNEIYETYGYYVNKQYSYIFDGIDGKKTMNQIMSKFRRIDSCIGSMQVVEKVDYIDGINSLPKSNVLRFVLKEGNVIIRPSGTEPKLKIYINTISKNDEKARKLEQEIAEVISRIIGGQ